MATIKSYTDINQSKKLAEILPLESADMFWRYNHNIHTYDDIPKILETNNWDDAYNKNIPCWSLAALLSVIPKHVKDYNVLRIDISDNDFAIWYDEIGYGVNNNLPNITMESAVDACYEIITRLNELNLL